MPQISAAAYKGQDMYFTTAIIKKLAMNLNAIFMKYLTF